MGKVVCTLLMMVALALSLVSWKRPIRLTWKKASDKIGRRIQYDSNGKATVADGLFLGIFLIFIIKDLLNSSSIIVTLPSVVSMGLNLSLLVLIIAKLCTQKYSWEMLCGYVLFGVMCLYTGLKMNDYYLLYTFILMICLQKVNLNRVMRFHVSFITQILLIHVLYFFVIWFTAKGSIPLFYRSGAIRYGFYMVHPNKFSMYLTWISLEWLYLKYEKVRGRSLLLMFAINFFCYCFTESRTSLIVILLSEILIFLMKNRRTAARTAKAVSFGARYGFAIGLVFYGIIAITYGRLGRAVQTIYEALDSFTNGRIVLSAYAQNTYGISFLGQDIISSGKFYWHGSWFDALNLDSCYSLLLWGYGVVYAIVLLFFFYRAACRSSSKIQMFLCIYALYGMFENYGLDAVVCFMPLLIWSECYGKKSSYRSKIPNRFFSKRIRANSLP